MNRATATALVLLYAVLVGACRHDSGDTAEAAKARALESARRAACAQELKVECATQIMTYCEAGDKTCPHYVACQDVARKVEAGEVCK